jgi:hypothetical protein
MKNEITGHFSTLDLLEKWCDNKRIKIDDFVGLDQKTATFSSYQFIDKN